MGEVHVSKEPGRQGFVMLRRWLNASRKLVLGRLRFEQPSKSRHRQFARIPGVVRSQLWISDLRKERCRNNGKSYDGETDRLDHLDSCRIRNLRN